MTVGLNSQTNFAIGVYVVCNIANIPIIAPTGVYSSPFGCSVRLQRNSDWYIPKSRLLVHLFDFCQFQIRLYMLFSNNPKALVFWR